MNLTESLMQEIGSIYSLSQAQRHSSVMVKAKGRLSKLSKFNPWASLSHFCKFYFVKYI